jgi:alpha-mannosidase
VTATTPAAAEVAAQAFARPLDALLVGTAQGSSASLAPSASLASVSGEAVLSAIKPAERGAGVIVRALLLPGPGQLQLGSSLAGAKLELVDLAERDVQSLGTAGATVRLDPAGTGSIVGLRLH